jgi:hypothetical protein
MFCRNDWTQPKTFLAIIDGIGNTFMVGKELPSEHHWCPWPYSNNAAGTCAIPPNAAHADGTPVDSWMWVEVYDFRSWHLGGLHVRPRGRLCALISNSIHLGLYGALATIQEGEVVILP